MRKKPNYGCVVAILGVIAAPFILVGGCCAFMASVVPDNYDASTLPDNYDVPSTRSQKDFIPGFGASDIYLNLEKMGFSVDKEILSDGWYWEATRDDGNAMLVVEIYGKSHTKVDSVQVMYFNNFGPLDYDDAAGFVSLIATLPYDGADREGARDWVRNNIRRNTHTTIGGVTFQLLSSDRSVLMYVFPESHAEMHGITGKANDPSVVSSPDALNSNDSMPETSVVVNEPTRTWTAKSGHTTEASYAGLEPGYVILRKSDGETVKVRLADLIEKDRREAVATARARGEFESSPD